MAGLEDVKDERWMVMNDNNEFQNSLLLLEEKMELLADLQQKAEKCR